MASNLKWDDIVLPTINVSTKDYSKEIADYVDAVIQYSANFQTSWKTITFDSFSNPTEVFSQTPCAECLLEPGSFGVVIIPKSVSFKVLYSEYLGLVEILKCKHPGSLRVQILNNGSYHGQCIDLLREYVILL